MDDLSKEAVLMFDEMSIDRQLVYNAHEDEIQGFVDTGFKRQNVLAKQVCVFIIAGLHKRWYIFLDMQQQIMVY